MDAFLYHIFQISPPPPFALAAQNAVRFRRLRPANGIGAKRYPIRDFVVQAVAMKLDDNVHVFAGIASPVSADRDDLILLKHTEGSRYDNEAVDGAPANPSAEESFQIFDVLQRRQQLAGKADMLDDA